MTEEMRKAEVVFSQREAPKVLNAILVTLEDRDHYPLIPGHRKWRSLRWHNSMNSG